MSHGLQVMVVIPVYNEADCIAHVVESWRDTLERLSPAFRILVLDDGSTDGTVQALTPLSADERIEIVSKPNSGHGSTILVGYLRASREAEWVFQCDGDDEMEAAHFERLWDSRHELDALFGTRCDRVQSTARALISAVSRLVVATAYAPGVKDVNTPYRLMRASLLAPIVDEIPEDTFAPNLVISGTLALAEARIANIDIPHRNRRTGSVSIVKWRLVKGVALSLIQTLALSFRMRGVARHIRTMDGPERRAA